MTLYDELLAANLVQGSRYSDLFVFGTPEAREIIARHKPVSTSSFKSNIDGAPLIEIPFAYAPYWEARGMKP